MKEIKLGIGLIVALFVATVVVAQPVAQAVDGAERESPEVKEVEKKDIREAEARHHQEQEYEQEVETAKSDAKMRSTEAKEAAKQRKLEVKADVCATKKEKLASSVPRLSESVSSIKKKLDAKYDKVKQLHADGKLTATNYDTLAANVDAAKAAAEVSIGLVDPTSVSVDCANSGLGQQLDSYRATVKEARTSLKTYHTALVALISALTASTTDKETTHAN